jgi:hypothetical protein
MTTVARLASFRVLLTTFAIASAPAWADVDVRIEARPATVPIEVFISVTDGGGPVGGLQATDFAVTIDGEPITIGNGDLTFPPAEDPTQRVSVVFTMDYSPSVVEAAGDDMEQAVVDFIDSMNDGDYAAIVKFNDTNPSRASIVAPFTAVVNGAGNNPTLEAAARSEYPGVGTNILDAIEVSLNHILAPPVALPPGPKSVILVSDGGEFDSLVEQSDVLALANENSIPIFTIGVADISQPGFEELLVALAGDTGGAFYPAPTPENIQDAYDTILVRLNNEYLLTIANGFTDCAAHELVVTVTGQAPVSVLFTRRQCDTEPDPFTFATVTGVDQGEVVTSDPETITGIEVPAQISIISGNYSITANGQCGVADSDFTNLPATISNGETVCIRQAASNAASTTKTTTLTVGGVAGTFSTTTVAGGGGGGGSGGGGGAAGLFELLLGLCLLLFRRQRTA